MDNRKNVLTYIQDTFDCILNFIQIALPVHKLKIVGKTKFKNFEAKNLYCFWIFAKIIPGDMDNNWKNFPTNIQDFLDRVPSCI